MYPTDAGLYACIIALVSMPCTYSLVVTGSVDTGLVLQRYLAFVVIGNCTDACDSHDSAC